MAAFTTVYTILEMLPELDLFSELFSPLPIICLASSISSNWVDVRLKSQSSVALITNSKTAPRLWSKVRCLIFYHVQTMHTPHRRYSWIYSYMLLDFAFRRSLRVVDFKFMITQAKEGIFEILRFWKCLLNVFAITGCWTSRLTYGTNRKCDITSNCDANWHILSAHCGVMTLSDCIMRTWVRNEKILMLAL